jgi:hypothetical protein
MKICIELKEDGTYSVYPKEEMDPMMGSEAPAAPKPTFDTLDEAFDEARSMLGGGEAEPAGAMMEGEEDFVAGFKKSRGMDQGY